jgi:hypothetical protein
MRSLSVVLALTAAIGFVAACGDDDQDDPTATPTRPPSVTTAAESSSLAPSLSPTAAAEDRTYPAGTTTGIDRLDEIIDAVLAGDGPRLLAQIVPLELACAVSPAGGIPQPPRCPRGVADGSVVEAFPVGGPEGSYLLAAEAQTAFRGLLDSSPGLYSVHRVTTIKPDPRWPTGDYAIVFVGLGQVRGVLVHATDEGIVNVTYGGGRTDPAIFVRNVPASDFLLPPLP